jgi:hypothetical protein
MSWSANATTTARYGAGTAVSAMNNTQLSLYLFSDVSLGVANCYCTDGISNGLLARILDGRHLDDSDFGDKVFIINKLGLKNQG